VFLALTSVVAVWRDIGIQEFTLATAWNVTNTVILGAFIAAAFREQHLTRHPLRPTERTEPPAATTPVTIVARPLPRDAEPAWEPRPGREPALEPVLVSRRASPDRRRPSSAQQGVTS
jgi:cellulose synthase (UDP-forming)